ncbi:hypothetical protein T10_5094 [Trichinella papuae]|uniref:Uncharacterized protein n=1 Tax=Trichinella papuae TaxID=268474 RepID=A0A0V1MV12_9BILA|nr:hypothetical protein T10_5094 [Trichinella papuae]
MAESSYSRICNAIEKVLLVTVVYCSLTGIKQYVQEQRRFDDVALKATTAERCLSSSK